MTGSPPTHLERLVGFFLSVGEACFSVRIDGQGRILPSLGFLGDIHSLPVAFLVRDEEKRSTVGNPRRGRQGRRPRGKGLCRSKGNEYSGTASSLSEGHHTMQFSAFDAVGKRQRLHGNADG
jgi:hypothetical protein